MSRRIAGFVDGEAAERLFAWLRGVWHVINAMANGRQIDELTLRVADVNDRVPTFERLYERLKVMSAKYAALQEDVAKQAALAGWPRGLDAQGLYDRAQTVHDLHAAAIKTGGASRTSGAAAALEDLQLSLLKAQLEVRDLEDAIRRAPLRLPSDGPAELTAAAVLLGGSKKASVVEERLRKAEKKATKLLARANALGLTPHALDAPLHRLGRAPFLRQLNVVIAARVALVAKLDRERKNSRFSPAAAPDAPAAPVVNEKRSIAQPLVVAIANFNVVLAASPVDIFRGAPPAPLTFQAVMDGANWTEPYSHTRSGDDDDAGAAGPEADQQLSVAAIAATKAVFTLRRVEEEILSVQSEMHGLASVLLRRSLELSFEAKQLLAALEAGQVVCSRCSVSCV